MLRIRFLLIAALALLLAPGAAAQKKQKDPVLQAYLEETFADLKTKLSALNDRLNTLEEQLVRLKQQQEQDQADLRSTLALLKTMDASFSSYRLSSQQEMISLKSELAAIRKDLAGVLEKAKAADAPAPAGPKVEGYITAVQDKDVTINLGSGHGVKVGSRLLVFKAADPKTQVGVIEIVEVLDNNNSRAKISTVSPGVKFEFGDMVRLEQ